MATWWFVRHGESMAQLGQWEGSNEETPLSPLGVQQAQGIAEELAELPVQRILVSPYTRARQTAKHAARLIGLEHQIVNHLHERLAGPDWRLLHNNPEFAPKLSTWDWRPRDGESIRDSAVRAIRTLHEHESPHNSLVFAHGRVLAGLLTALDQSDTAQPIHALENCVAHERIVEPGTWARLLNALDGED